jgi:hypothetical protein
MCKEENNIWHMCDCESAKTWSLELVELGAFGYAWAMLALEFEFGNLRGRQTRPSPRRKRLPAAERAPVIGASVCRRPRQKGKKKLMKA